MDTCRPPSVARLHTLHEAHTNIARKNLPDSITTSKPEEASLLIPACF